MWRFFHLLLGVTLVSFQATSGDEPKKKPDDAKKPDGHLTISFEAKGRLSLVQDAETRTITGVHLVGGTPFLRPIPLAADKKLHAAVRGLDGQIVTVTGVGTPYVIFGSGSRNHEEGVRLLITGIQAAKEKH